MNTKKTQVSETVIRRLPKYHRYLEELLDNGVDRISSQELSKLTGFTASQIRQDLNNFGGFGQQGYGYNVEDLKGQIDKILGIQIVYDTIIVGAGRLGSAISDYTGFKGSGFNIIALFDKDEKLVGTNVGDIPVRHSDELSEFINKEKVEVGIITVPREGAQSIADVMTSAGIKGIWNFAPTDLIHPEEVFVENVRLNDSLLTLSYYLKEANDK